MKEKMKTFWEDYGHIVAFGLLGAVAAYTAGNIVYHQGYKDGMIEGAITERYKIQDMLDYMQKIHLFKTVDCDTNNVVSLVNFVSEKLRTMDNI